VRDPPEGHDEVKPRLQGIEMQYSFMNESAPQVLQDNEFLFILQRLCGESRYHRCAPRTLPEIAF